MAIVSSESILKGFQSNGYKTIQYKFTDHLANVFVTPSRHVHPTNFDIAADIVKKQARLDEELIKNERHKFRGQLSNTVTPEYQTKAQLFKANLKFLLKSRIADVMQYRASVSFLASLSDNQVKNILDVNDTKLAIIRTWQNNMLTVAAIEDSHIPINGD